jgi:anti-anti-sigma factor
MSYSTDHSSGADHLRIRVSRREDRVTVVLAGDLDRLTGPGFIDHMDRVRKHAIRRIDVDLAEVAFLDLGGLRALLYVHHRAAQDGVRLAAHNPRHYVRWLLDTTGAAEVLLANHAPSTSSRVNRDAEHGPAGKTPHLRLMRERTMRADDRDRLADEREKLLDERQQRVFDHQQWENIREDLADQREHDLERRERDD